MVNFYTNMIVWKKLIAYLICILYISITSDAYNSHHKFAYNIRSAVTTINRASWSSSRLCQLHMDATFMDATFMDAALQLPDSSAIASIIGDTFHTLMTPINYIKDVLPTSELVNSLNPAVDMPESHQYTACLIHSDVDPRRC